MHEQIPDRKTRKDAIRKAVLSRRRSLDATEAEARSQKIRGRLRDFDLLSDARCVHAFWPIHEKREVDLRPLLRQWVNDGRTVVLPVVRRPDSGSDLRLEHRRFTLEDHLVLSDWGIAEPVSGEEVAVDEIDAVLVPALSVDAGGTRIGYGMGFYDRFLREVDAVRICPIYDEDMTGELPREAHDEPVDIAVTEHRTMTLRRT